MAANTKIPNEIHNITLVFGAGVAGTGEEGAGTGVGVRGVRVDVGCGAGGGATGCCSIWASFWVSPCGFGRLSSIINYYTT